MSFWKNDHIQVNEYEFVVGDANAVNDAGTAGIYILSAKPNKASLPLGAVLVSFDVVGQTQFVGSGASIKIGTLADDDQYLASTVVASATPTLLASGTTHALVSAANLADVRLTVTGGTITAGKVKVLLAFIFPNS